MSVTRRVMLGGMGATVVAQAAPRPLLAAPAMLREIVARPGQAELLEPVQPKSPVWGYGGGVPGPEIRTRQGKDFAVQLLNKLPQPTTIHWHGIRNDNAMDGVAGLTQDAVAPGETFAYRFAPPDAGTFWYHPHNRTWEQLARGLYGAFIVEERNPPAVDHDRVLIFDDWRVGDDGKIDDASFGNFHDLSHAGRLGNILTVNGQFSHDVLVKAGERVRLRLVNAANARVMTISFPRHTPRVIALDGQPVSPFPMPTAGMRLAPAQRADVILDATEDVGRKTPIQVATGRANLVAGHLIYHPTQRKRRAALSENVVLPSNPMPTALRDVPDVVVKLDMTGGARSWFESAVYRGKTYDVRTLAREHQKVWAFNGIAGPPEVPLAQFAVGQTVHVQMINRTAWPHAMHFHGYHVREVAHSHRAPLPHWRDTIFMARDEQITVGFRAHNPGKWMLHCHMLEHQAGGMATWFEVT